MKTAIFLLIGALVLSFGAIALADGPQDQVIKGPALMTDTQMDDVVAGGVCVCDPIRDRDRLCDPAGSAFRKGKGSTD